MERFFGGSDIGGSQCGGKDKTAGFVHEIIRQYFLPATKPPTEAKALLSVPSWISIFRAAGNVRHCRIRCREFL